MIDNLPTGIFKMPLKLVDLFRKLKRLETMHVFSKHVEFPKCRQNIVVSDDLGMI